MTTQRFTFSFLLTFLLLGLWVPASTAQEVSLGADLMSRYVWRGADFGESVSIQPALTVGGGGLEVGAWASYSFSPEAADVSELDLWFGYGIETAQGTFSFGVTDYYFPNAGVALFDFSSEGAGAHWIEPFVGYAGPESFPISLYAGIFAYNDPDNSIYLEAAFPLTVDGTELSLTAGASGGASALYGTDGFALVNLGLSAAKAVPITDSFSLPLQVGFIINPSLEKSYLVFGLSL